jgi:addiction module HigA family antidote
MPTTPKSSTTTSGRKPVAEKRTLGRRDEHQTVKGVLKSASVAADRLAPVHPGEVLQEEFLGPMGISVYRLAAEIGVPAPRVNDIVLRRRGVSADTALRLAKYFGTSEKFWLGIQADYDLDVERERAGESLAKIQRVDLAKPWVSRGRRRSGGAQKLIFEGNVTTRARASKKK